MFNLCMALYAEAQPFIERLQLKKSAVHPHFQIFEGPDTRLIITGLGEVQAAVAAAYYLANYPMEENDIFWNVGVAAAKATRFQLGTCCVCNKIVELSTGRTFYPDMLFRHPFFEAELQTSPQTAVQGVGKEVLIDMEAAGIYQAAQPFCRLHQLAFFKVVSDRADGKLVKPEQVRSLIAVHTETIIHLALQVQKALQARRITRFTDLEQKEIDRAAAEHGLSLTQQRQMEQYLYYDKLQGGSLPALLSEMPGRMDPGKQEGKRYLEQLRAHIL